MKILVLDVCLVWKGVLNVVYSRLIVLNVLLMLIEVKILLIVLVMMDFCLIQLPKFVKSNLVLKNVQVVLQDQVLNVVYVKKETIID